MKKKYSFDRISYNNQGTLFVDRKHEAMIFSGNKKEFIRTNINCMKGEPFEEEIAWDLLEIFNLYEEITEKELLEKGYIIISNEDPSGVYHIEAGIPSEEPVSTNKTVLRTYRLLA